MMDKYEELEPRRAATKQDIVDWVAGLGDDDLPYCRNCKHWRPRPGEWEAQRQKESGFEDSEFVELFISGTCARFPPHPKYGQPETRDMDECGEHCEGEHWTLQYIREVHEEESGE